MGLVESNVVFITKPMETKDTLGEYYREFKEQVNTTEAHSGNPVYHSSLSNKSITKHSLKVKDTLVRRRRKLRATRSQKDEGQKTQTQRWGLPRMPIFNDG